MTRGRDSDSGTGDYRDDCDASDRHGADPAAPRATGKLDLIGSLFIHG